MADNVHPLHRPDAPVRIAMVRTAREWAAIARACEITGALAAAAADEDAGRGNSHLLTDLATGIRRELDDYPGEAA